MRDTLPYLLETDFPALNRTHPPTTLQANITRKCNQQCVHCHVNASPLRTEMMTDATIELLFAYIKAHDIKTLDLTGGAPELHPAFYDIVQRARALGVHVMDRCNLTILLEPGFAELGEFLARHEVEVTASLPCYQQENVDKQRGQDVFAKSIQACQRLNQLGYGHSKTPELQFNLVYNPPGPVLPPDQVTLEADYRKHLRADYQIEFTQLFVLINMPIKRFGSMLLSQQSLASYLQLLKEAFVRDNLAQVMCRDLISVDWQGYVYDCDFNQMLDLPLTDKQQTKLHIEDLLAVDLSGQEITVCAHCYGCTAGQGSSCGGALNTALNSTLA